MYDLQSFNGCYKGNIAECMFKLVNANLVITKFFNKAKYMQIFGKYYNQDQIKFLNDNWYSIDGIEIKFVNGVKNIILYEIKSKNAVYSKFKKWPLKITRNTFEIYSKSKSLGFQPKLATVWFLENWHFDVKIKDFDSARWTIDKPKKYDKK